jgi:glucan phosphoethanolaminetransferase (alkaline phosphatase superfamily)
MDYIYIIIMAVILTISLLILTNTGYFHTSLLQFLIIDACVIIIMLIIPYLMITFIPSPLNSYITMGYLCLGFISAIIALIKISLGDTIVVNKKR